MAVTLILKPMTAWQQDQLRQEFPSLRLVFLKSEDQELSADEWQEVEVLYADVLSSDDFEKAERLRWIHCPQAELDGLCIDSIRDRGNVIVTRTPEENAVQAAEYVMAVAGAFVKRLFHWQQSMGDPGDQWEDPVRDQLGTVSGKILLQIGLDRVGTEISKLAGKLGMRVRGVHYRRLFHPNCERTVSESDLHSILPVADVVVIAMPRVPRYREWFGEAELELMKEGSILVVLTPSGVVDEVALAKIALSGKFTGVAMDTCSQNPLPKSSPLWTVPNLIISPAISRYPHCRHEAAFRTFRHNLRQFLPSNYTDMDYAIDWDLYAGTAT